MVRYAGDKVVGGNYSAPSTNLQIGEGRQVHECVADDAADVIVVQIPTVESSLAGD